MSIITVTVGSYTFDETQIIINPTISKSICSGGFSAGNTACGCLKVGVPNNGHSEGTSVKISYGGNQIMGEFFISDIEKCGYAKLRPTDVYKTQMVMLTCYDGMSKLDDYMSFDLTTVTPADICDEIESQTGYLFEDGSKIGSSFEVPKEEAESRTMREWLGIFGCYIGCNWTLRTYWLDNQLVSRITKLPLYYSGNNFSAVINAPVTVENAVTFSRVVSRGKDGTFKSGTDSDYTLNISCQYATQDSNDTIKNNIASFGMSYTAFKCDKLKTDYVSMDIGDNITFSGYGSPLKIYNQTVTISINGIYMSVGADVQKKTLNEEIEYSSGSSGLENVSNFAGAADTEDNTKINLTWEKPASAQNVIIKRKRSTPFNNAIDDGDIIAVTSGETLADTIPTLWYSYFYRTLTNAGDLYNGKDNSIMIPAITRGKYLYNAGDECKAITGGWSGGNGVTGVNITYGSLVKNTDHIAITALTVTDTRYKYYGVKTTNKVNFTGFTKICAEFEITQMRTYDITNGLGDDTARAREMPYFSYADTYINSGLPKVTPEQCPYVVATFRLKNYFQGSYYVYFLNQPPMLVYDSNGIMKLSSINSTIKRKVIYYGDTQTPWKVTTDGIDGGLLIQPPGTPDTVTYGNYMGGGYDNGGNHVYAFSGFTNPILPPEYRAFVGTRNQSDYIYTALVSHAYKDYKDDLGTFVIEAPITDLDTSVVPNVSQAWVCAGAFESNIKLLSVWLQE